MLFTNFEIKSLLSTLWVFVTVNYIFCDIFTLMHAPELEKLLTGSVGGTKITEGFLLTFAFILELPMLMIVLSKYLNYGVNRISNIVVAMLMTTIQGGSLFVDKLSLHYIFFSVVEISTTIFILLLAYNWPKQINVKPC